MANSISKRHLTHRRGVKNNSPSEISEGNKSERDKSENNSRNSRAFFSAQINPVLDDWPSTAPAPAPSAVPPTPCSRPDGRGGRCGSCGYWESASGLVRCRCCRPPPCEAVVAKWWWVADVAGGRFEWEELR